VNILGVFGEILLFNNHEIIMKERNP